MQLPPKVTNRAFDRLAEIIPASSEKGLRVAVEGGGCSGFSYKFDFASDTNEDDIVIERDGAKVVIDEVSVPFLEGSEIDYVTEVIGSAFRISNPNATAACGCGTSFALS